jgi:membrane-associated phospholipid phosphatase
LLAGAAGVGTSFLLDDRVGAALDATQDHTLNNVAWWCSKMGEGWVIAVMAIFFSAIYFLRNRPQVAAQIFFVGLTSELTGLAATILRVMVGRTRPLNHDVPQGFYGVWHDGHWIVGEFKFSAFPSGHAASAVGLMAAAWLLHRGWGVVLGVYALAVMWSRIALECHHLSDVLASALLSVVLAVWLKKVLLTPLESQFGKIHRAWRRN